MKPIINSLLLIALLAFSTNVFAQADDFLLLRIYESPSSSNFSKIIVTQNGDLKEVVDLNNMTIKHLEENQLIIHATIQKHLDSGYEINSSSSAGATGTFITTYMLKKKD